MPTLRRSTSSHTWKGLFSVPGGPHVGLTVAVPSIPGLAVEVALTVRVAVSFGAMVKSPPVVLIVVKLSLLFSTAHVTLWETLPVPMTAAENCMVSFWGTNGVGGVTATAVRIGGGGLPPPPPHGPPALPSPPEAPPSPPDCVPPPVSKLGDELSQVIKRKPINATKATICNNFTMFFTITPFFYMFFYALQSMLTIFCDLTHNMLSR